MEKDRSPPDVVVRDSKGQYYYAPGSSLIQFDLPDNHPLADHFDVDRARSPKYNVAAVMGRVEHVVFVMEDGQGASIPGGGYGLPCGPTELE